MMRNVAMGLAVSLAVLLTGCGGGGAQLKTSTTTVSIGQQLIDLKKARDSGAITEADYEHSKKQLIDSVLND